MLRDVRTIFTSAGLLAVVFLSLAGCSGATSPGPSESGAPSPGVSIPTDELPPDTRCLVEHGFKLVAVLPPEIEGDAPGYKLESDLPPEQATAVVKECQKLAPPNVPKTDAELRVIYDRWVDERDCLIELGYRPVPPPSFERFTADWRSTGPWMPIDGVDTGSWSDAEYREAKDRCTLEFFSRD
jgi:hypothetical protein